MKAAKVLAVITLLALATGTARSAGRVIYPPPQQARADIANALRTARATHKRVLLDFGGNWCSDCQVLDIYIHNAQNLPLLNANFVLVHVNVGQFDANLDLTAKYGIPIRKGVPALAVLSDTGRVLFSQKRGEFNSMGTMKPSSVTQFLVEWRPQRKDCSVVAVNC